MSKDDKQLLLDLIDAYADSRCDCEHYLSEGLQMSADHHQRSADAYRARIVEILDEATK